MSVAIRFVFAVTGITQYGIMERFSSSSLELSCKCLCSRPLSIRWCSLAVIWSWSDIVIGSIVCFAIFFHPLFSRLTLLPQYSHVTTISPKLGKIGALQFGHFISFTSVPAYD